MGAIKSDIHKAAKKAEQRDHTMAEEIAALKAGMNEMMELLKKMR